MAKIKPKLSKKPKSQKSDWEILPIAKTGRVIEDNMGQWKYPGEITKINSPNITMQGVNYPVLGVSDTNDVQMMYPNQDYEFEGSSVTEYPLPEAGGGYRVIRSNERKGKTHKVIGPDGTVKFFGDSKLGQHPKDPARKKAFYARHKKNLAGNPYFRAFARKTWEEGGELDFAQEGLITLPKDKSQYSSDDSLKHQMAKTFMYEDKRGGAQGNHIPNFGYYNSTLPNFVPPTNLQEAVNYAMKEYAPKLIPYQTAMEKGEAFDFLYNTGKDPRAYSIQEYYRKYDPTKLDKEGKWSGRTGSDFDSLYKNTIAKLPENERRVLMNKGRDWYYQNINNPSPGVPSPAYKNTWYGRIWNTNNFLPFNPNNPNFTPKKKEGGMLPDLMEMAFGGNVILKKYQQGGNSLEGDLYSKVLMNRNRDKDFVKRAYAVGQYPNSNMFQRFADFDTRQSHEMGWGEDESGQAYMFPTIMNPGNEAIPVPNMYADYISSQGYKNAAGIKYENGGNTWEIVSDNEWEIIK